MGDVLATADPFDVMYTDHQGRGDEAGSECVPLAEVFPEHGNVDAACVERVMAPGRAIGTYVLDGQCHSVVTDALELCDPDTPPEPGS